MELDLWLGYQHSPDWLWLAVLIACGVAFNRNSSNLLSGIAKSFLLLVALYVVYVVLILVPSRP